MKAREKTASSKEKEILQKVEKEREAKEKEDMKRLIEEKEIAAKKAKETAAKAKEQEKKVVAEKATAKKDAPVTRQIIAGKTPFQSDSPDILDNLPTVALAATGVGVIALAVNQFSEDSKGSGFLGNFGNDRSNGVSSGFGPSPPGSGGNSMFSSPKGSSSSFGRGGSSSFSPSGGGFGGASNAAGFLSRFVNPEGKGWLHFDLASAFNESPTAYQPAGASGKGIRTIAALLLDPSTKQHSL